MIEVKDVIVFVLSTLLVKYILVEWSADQLSNFLKWLLVKSKRDHIIWAHYKDRAINQGHKANTPFACQDDACKQI